MGPILTYLLMINESLFKSEKVKIVVITIFGFIFYMLVFITHFSGLRYFDGVDYAQIARNIYHGRLTTDVICPLFLSLNKEISNHPNLLRPPLYPFIVSLYFKVFGISDAALFFASATFYILSGPIVYLIGKKLFNEEVGLYSSILFLLSPFIINYAMSGLTETTFLFFFLLLIYTLIMEYNSFTIGIISGLAYLTRYNFLILMIGVFIYFLMESEKLKVKLKNIVTYIVGFVIIIFPWVMRNYLITGNPFFSWNSYEIIMFNSINQEYDVYRTFYSSPPQVAEFILTHPLVMVKKTISGAANLYLEIPKIIDPLLFAFGITSILIILNNKSTYNKNKRILAMLATMFSLQYLFLSIVHPLPRLFVVFIPFLIILAVYCLQYLTYYKKISGLRLLHLILAVIILLNISGTFVAGFSQKEEYFHRNELKFLNKRIEQNAVIITDIPWITAWYVNRTSIWIPKSFEDFKKITILCSENNKSIYVYLTTRDFGTRRWYQYSDEYLENPDFREISELIVKFDSGNLLFKVYKN